MILKSYRIFILAGIAVGLMVLSGYSGYKISEASWLKKQVKVEAMYRAEQEKILEKLSVALNNVEKARQERRIEYREKIKYIKSDAPECSITDDRLHELQCLATPSKCKG